MPGITPSRWLPLVVVVVLTPFLHATKILKISEITKHFVNYFVNFSKLSTRIFNISSELYKALCAKIEIS